MEFPARQEPASFNIDEGDGEAPGRDGELLTIPEDPGDLDLARPDTIAAFYDRHPYPPPVDDLAALAARSVTIGVDVSPTT